MIDFPASPVDGQLFAASNGVIYIWQASPAPGIWAANGGAGAGVTGSGKYVLQNSPELIGTPTAPTPPVGDRSGRIATTDWLDGEDATGSGIRVLQTSPKLLSTPLAPVALVDNVSSQIATTNWARAWVQQELQALGLAWTINDNIGVRFVEEFNYLDHGTANMTDDGGGLISSWKGRKTALNATAAAGARPKWIAGKGVLFHLANVMETVGIGPLAFAGTSGSIWFLGYQLALDDVPHNLVSYGSTVNARVLRVSGVTHKAAATDNAGTTEETTRRCSGLVAMQAKFQNGRLYVRMNGTPGPDVASAFNTANTMLRLGASLAGPTDRFATAYFQRVLFFSGDTTLDEDMRTEAELLGAEAYKYLPEGHPYRVPPPPLSYAATMAKINAAIAAAPASTPDQEVVMPVTPTITITAGAPNPVAFPLSADVDNELPLITIDQGWTTPDGGSYVISPMGLLGYLLTPSLFAQTTSFRARVLATCQKIAVHVFGVIDSEIRLIVRPVADPVGKYATLAGETMPGPSGSTTVVYDLGSNAQREISAEIPASNKFAGFFVEAGNLLEPAPPAADVRIAWESDSFGSGVGATQRWWAFNILTGDRLGLTAGQFAGNVGGGWLAGSPSGIYTLQQRLNDITDADLAERHSIGISALTDGDGVVISLGVNDVPIELTAEQWTAVMLPMLLTIRANMPWAPIVCVGPWDRYFPAAVSAGWRAVDDGLQAAVAQVEHCEYLSMEGVDYEKVGDGNIHPTNLGHQQIANNLAPRLEATLISMAG